MFQLGGNSLTQSFGQVETPTADDACGAQEQGLHFGEFWRRPIKGTEGLVSAFNKIGRDHCLWSGIQWCPAQNVAQRPKVGTTVLVLAGEVTGCIDEQISQFRLRLNGKAFQ